MVPATPKSSRGLPASVVVSGESERLNVEIRDVLSHEMFRVYTSTDPLGVELAGGALKNILGIAAGICDGLAVGDNGKAALLTHSLVKLHSRLGVTLGARHETFYGLAGVGDVVTTCYSPFGRNRSVGERIGRGEAIEHVLAAWSMSPRECPRLAACIGCGRAGRRDADNRRALSRSFQGQIAQVCRGRFDGAITQGGISVVVAWGRLARPFNQPARCSSGLRSGSRGIPGGRKAAANSEIDSIRSGKRVK